MIPALFYAILSFMGLLLTMGQHQRKLINKKFSTAQNYSLQFGAIALLVVSSWPLTSQYGTSIGLIMWLMLLAPIAFAVMMLLSFSGAKKFLYTLGFFCFFSLGALIVQLIL